MVAGAIHSARHLWRVRAIIAGVFLLFVPSAVADYALSKEKKLKAAYLFNFTKYIEWPAKAGSDQPLVIDLCVDESPEFIGFLSELVLGRRVGPLEQSVVVHPLNMASNCDIIFSARRLGTVQPEFANVMIVADSKDGVPGAAIYFFIEENRVRFSFRPETLEKLDVRVSSELLKLARSVS